MNLVLRIKLEIWHHIDVGAAYAQRGFFSIPGDNLDEYKKEEALQDDKYYSNFPSTGLGGSGFIEGQLERILIPPAGVKYP